MDQTERRAAAAAGRLASSLGGVLGATVRSVVLHGSSTLGDFQPGRSDLDLLVVVDRELTEREIESLVGVARDADPSPAGGLDLLVVTATTAADPREHPALELQVGRSRSGHAPDLWPELSMARADGRALIGPEPPVVIGEVPFEAVQDNGRHWLRTWLDRTSDQTNAVHMILTACRIWRFSAEGRHSSKSAAARWALQRDPSLDAVRQALAQRIGGVAARIEPADIRDVLETVLRHVDRRD
jgi:predicted nucleotidyltransferase